MSADEPKITDMREIPSAVCETLTLIQGPLAFEKHLHKILATAERRLHILSKDLDPTLFSNEKTCSLISALARRHPSIEIKLLVKEPKALIGHRHRLAALHQRLPSKIELRHLLTEPNKADMGYVIVDGRQLLLQHGDGEYDGFCNTDAAAESRSLLDEFNELWGRQSGEIKELRPLSI